MKKTDYYVRIQRDGKKMDLIITAYSRHQIYKHFHRSATFLIFEYATDKDRKRKNVKNLEFSEDTPEQTFAEIIEGAKEEYELYREMLHSSIEETYKRLDECKELGAWDFQIVDDLKHGSGRAQDYEKFYNNSFTNYCNLKSIYKELFKEEYEG